MRSRGWKYPEEDEMRRGKKLGYTHAQVSSMVLATALFCYCFFIAVDVPMSFMTGAFLLFMLNPVIRKIFGETIGKVLYAFSLTLCIGAFVLALM